MRLFIRLQNNQPFEHPIFEDNMRQAFPDVNLDNLPNNFAEFIRHEPPTLALYEFYDGVTYEWIDGKVQDVHHVRPMTKEERIELQNKFLENWARDGYPSWTFNPEDCSFSPPVPKPTDGKIYRWDEPTLTWVEID
jgi:hypothetical protein